VLLMLLARAGIIDVAQLRAFRRYAIVAAFVIAAVLTPPDVISQLLLAIPTFSARSNDPCERHAGEDLGVRKTCLQQVIEQRIGLSQEAFDRHGRRN